MDLARALERHERAAERFTALIGSLGVGAVPLPGFEWTATEMGAHVLSLYRGYERAAIEHLPLWPSTDSADGNQRLLDATPERDPAAIAAALPDAGAAMRSAFEVTSGPIVAFGEVAASPAAILAVNMADTLTHGYDISRALGAEWVIDADDAILAQRGLSEILPGFVRADSTLTATYGVTLRGGPTWTIRFENGEVTTDEVRPDRADCRINADPVAWILGNYGRISPVTAALTGKVIAYGRRPWIAPRLGDQFDPV